VALQFSTSNYMEVIEFEITWPNHINVINLRKFIISEISKKGEIIRWSIQEINSLKNLYDAKTIKINAVLLV